GPFRPNLDGTSSLIGPVVPFDQIDIDLAARCIAGELTGSSGALERAREDAGEARPDQVRSQSSRIELAALRQGDVGPARVPSRNAPIGFAVTDEPHCGQLLWIGHGEPPV